MNELLDRHGGRTIVIDENDCVMTGGLVESFGDGDTLIEIHFGCDAAYFNIVERGESVCNFAISNADAERFAQAVLLKSRRAVVKKETLA